MSAPYLLEREAARALESRTLDARARESERAAVDLMRGFERFEREVRVYLEFIALARADCTGAYDARTGSIQHDGETCPIHERGDQ